MNRLLLRRTSVCAFAPLKVQRAGTSDANSSGFVLNDPPAWLLFVLLEVSPKLYIGPGESMFESAWQGGY